MQDQKNTVGVSEGETNVWMMVGMMVAGLIVGFLIGWFWHKDASQVDIIDGSEENASTTNILATSTVPELGTIYKTIDTPAFVSVDNQRAGSLVFIKHVEASKPTWIAVREIADETVANILGAGMVTSATDDVPVTLLRPTEVGGKYAVFLYQDNGDGQFDSKVDLLVMQGGVPVATQFTAQ